MDGQLEVAIHLILKHAKVMADLHQGRGLVVQLKASRIAPPPGNKLAPNYFHGFEYTSNFFISFAIAKFGFHAPENPMW